jgi:NADH-quinone oxidoreductase subunit M
VESTTSGSIALAAILLKFGLFGMIRFMLGMLHEMCETFAPFVVGLSLFSVFFAAICSIREPDVKKLIAYTSISHMSLSVLALFVFDLRGLYGVIFTMLGHAVTSTALFYLIGIIYTRLQTRDVIMCGGLVHVMPIFSSILFFFAIANAGFPCSLSFTGELFIYMGIFKKLSLPAICVLILSSILLLYSNLKLFMSMCFGTLNSKFVPVLITDLTHLELFCLTVCLGHGIVPFISFN